jgi:hypothetical protein
VRLVLSVEPTSRRRRVEAREPAEPGLRRRCIALDFLHYNFVRVHQTLRVTPAMAAGVVDTLWDIGDLLRVVEEWEAKQPHEKPGRKPKAPNA